jgi:hypothetical protein
MIVLKCQITYCRLVIVAVDSFEKIKKGAKETGKGVEDTSEGAIETAEGVKDAAEGVVEGVKDAAEGVVEGVKDAAEGVKEKVEETTEKVTESDTYSTSDEETEKRDYKEAGGKEPMNPEDIAAHEPTVVKRDQDTEIAGEGETGTDSPEAREKFRKKGMTET